MAKGRSYEWREAIMAKGTAMRGRGVWPIWPSQDVRPQEARTRRPTQPVSAAPNGRRARPRRGQDARSHTRPRAHGRPRSVGHERPWCAERAASGDDSAATSRPVAGLRPQRSAVAATTVRGGGSPSDPSFRLVKSTTARMAALSASDPGPVGREEKVFEPDRVTPAVSMGPGWSTVMDMAGWQGTLNNVRPEAPMENQRAAP